MKREGGLLILPPLYVLHLTTLGVIQYRNQLMLALTGVGEN